jgi:hypothetical protein
MTKTFQLLIGHLAVILSVLNFGSPCEHERWNRFLRAGIKPTDGLRINYTTERTPPMNIFCFDKSAFKIL